MGSVQTILQANNITRVDKGKYDAAVMVQRAGNKAEAAKASLADFSRSLGNSLRIEGAGKEFNEAQSQLAESLETRGTGRINASLSAAERIGALKAQAAAMGVGGSSVDTLNATVRLQRNIEQDLKDQATERMASRGGRANAQIMDNAYNTIDLSQTQGNFDHTVYIEPKKMKRRLGKLIGVAVATYFGGPQAGEAVADMAVGSWQASNANFSGAASNFDSAIQNGIGAHKSWSSLQGEDGSTSWFRAVTQKRNQQADKADAQSQAINWGAFAPDSNDTFGSGFGSNWWK